MEQINKGLEFLAKTLVTFLLLELIVLPFRSSIITFFSTVLFFLPDWINISWECTAIDEVLLFASALLWTPMERRKKFKAIIIGTAVIEAYNIFRIVFLAYFPDPLLHDLLFRWGGFAVILIVYYIFARKH